jgi:eukaryotic-like serine/threonine-protein kinase
VDEVGIGTTLGGRFELHELIGSGGMAGVWRGTDLVLDRPVAVKILHSRLADDTDLRERFRAEALAAARLTHPSIVNVFDTGTDGDVAYIVMELFEGETLSERLSRGGAMEPAEAADVMVQVLTALQFAHEAGLVHRDVKPANILVGRDRRAKVADFGIAKAAYAGNDPTTTGRVLGSVPYLAPEQVKGSGTDARSDIYAAGASLYEALTGRPPFTAETDIAAAMLRLTQDPEPPRAIRPGIPRPLEAIVMRALERDPERRFATAEDMAAALVRLHQRAPGPGRAPARVPARAPAPQGGVFRRWMLVPLLALLVVAAAIAVGLLVGILEPGGPLGVRVPDETDSPAPGDGAGRLLDFVAVEAHDPFGTLGENDDEVGLAVDGDPTTFWRTENYDQLDMDKDGVGLLFDLGRSQRVTEFSLRTPGDGWRFEVRAGDDRDALATGPGGSAFVAEESMREGIDPVRGRYVLLWVTEVSPQEDGANRAIVAEFRVFGAGD